MKKLMAAILAFVVVTATATGAEAGRFLIGQKDNFHELVDVPLQGPNGEDLVLGDMVQVQLFGAGVWMKDLGLVLQVKDGKSYYNMPTGVELKRFQDERLLPNPLPTYQIRPIDYVFGYSAWLLLAIGILWTFAPSWFKAWRAKLKAA